MWRQQMEICFVIWKMHFFCCCFMSERDTKISYNTEPTNVPLEYHLISTDRNVILISTSKTDSFNVNLDEWIQLQRGHLPGIQREADRETLESSGNVPLCHCIKFYVFWWFCILMTQLNLKLYVLCLESVWLLRTNYSLAHWNV